MWVKILQGNDTGQFVDQRQDEAENNIATGFARLLTEQELRQLHISPAARHDPGEAPPAEESEETTGDSDADGDAGGSEETAEVLPTFEQLKKMKKAVLTEMANGLKVEFDSHETRADLAAKIVAKRAEPAGG